MVALNSSVLAGAVKQCQAHEHSNVPHRHLDRSCDRQDCAKDIACSRRAMEAGAGARREDEEAKQRWSQPIPWTGQGCGCVHRRARGGRRADAPPAASEARGGRRRAKSGGERARDDPFLCSRINRRWKIQRSIILDDVAQ